MHKDAVTNNYHLTHSRSWVLRLPKPKKPIFSYTKGPRTKFLELPPTPRAAALMGITTVEEDAEAGRGGAPNNQGEILNTR